MSLTLHSVVSRLRLVRRYVESLITTVGLLIFVLWLFEPCRTWLETHHIIDEHVIVAIVGLGIALVIDGFYELRYLIEPLINTTTSRIVENGVTGVYEAVDRVIEEKPTTRFPVRRSRTVEVLGLTLFSAWPHLCGHPEDPTITGWEITLLCIDPEFADQQPGITEYWRDTARSQTENITAYIITNREKLRKRRMKVRLINYSVFPTVHGFRIDNTSLFISFCHWNEDGKLRDPYQFYEYFHASDDSARANNYRRLFSNWFEAAVLSSKSEESSVSTYD